MPIRDALEAAFVLARRDSARLDAPPPPRGLIPVLRFNRLPDRALIDVKRALDSDEGFRSRVLEAIESGELSGDALDQGARLFLERPEGWQESLALLTDEVVASEQRSSAERAESEATRRAESAESALEQSRSERHELRLERNKLRSELDSLRAEVARAGTVESGLRGELEAALAERGEAVRQLKELEALAGRRLERQRELEERVADLESASMRSDPPRGDADGAEPDRPAGSAEHPTAAGAALEALSGSVTPQLRSAADAAAELARSIAAIAESIAAVAESFAELTGSARGAEGSEAPREPVRSEPRRAVRLGRGLSADSVEGLEEFLARPETFVLIDGYNVSMKGWPHLSPLQQRDSLLDLLAPIDARSAADIHVVFDGAYDGRRPAVGTPLPVRVHFTEAGVEADDRLLEFVDDAPLEDAVVVVSSDKRVRDGARERGATPVSSETLLERGRRR